MTKFAPREKALADRTLLSGLAGVSDWFGLVHLTKAVVRH